MSMLVDCIRQTCLFADGHAGRFGTLGTASPEVIDGLVAVASLFVVTAVGLVAGYVASHLTMTMCARLGFDHAAERGGLVRLLKQVGIEKNPSQIMGAIVLGLMACTFLMVGSDVLGFDAIGDAVGRLVDYIPRVILAAIVLIVGLLLATLLRGAVVAAGERANVPGAQHLGTTCFYVAAFVVIFAAFEQLQIRMQLLGQAFLIAFSSLALASGLAVGLGGRDVVAGMIAGYYIRRRYQAGDQVAVAGLQGTVREVSMVTTIVETDDHGLLKRHSVPNVKMLNEAVS